MPFDILSVILGVTIVFIFMAIFTLLRTMNSPFIYRFVPILKEKMEKLAQVANGWCIRFKLDSREFELLEVKFDMEQGRKKIYNDFIFLRTKSKKPLSLRFYDVFNEKKIKFIDNF